MQLDSSERKLLKKYLPCTMDEIHRICVKHNIRYSLFYGSLIGKVVYKDRVYKRRTPLLRSY